MTRVGVLGAGQLGRMLALAGYPLGLRLRFLDPAPESPAEHLAERLPGGFHDEAALDRFATRESSASSRELLRYEGGEVRVARSSSITGIPSWMG